MEHDLSTKRATGFGKWQQCRQCGATFHSGFWWHGGYRSKEKPYCQPGLGFGHDEEWRKQAEIIEDFKQ